MDLHKLLQEKCRLKNIKAIGAVTEDNRFFLDINGVTVKIIGEQPRRLKSHLNIVRWRKIVERIIPFITNFFLKRTPHLIVVSNEWFDFPYVREFKETIFRNSGFKLFFIDFRKKDWWEKLLLEINNYR